MLGFRYEATRFEKFFRIIFRLGYSFWYYRISWKKYLVFYLIFFFSKKYLLSVSRFFNNRPKYGPSEKKLPMCGAIQINIHTVGIKLSPAPLQWLFVKTPRGWGFFRLASTENSEKKPHPLSCFFKSKAFLYYWQKKELGVGFFFQLASAQNVKKNPPPWRFSRKTPVLSPPPPFF